MRIALYAPFKPLDHPEPSGDRTIGRLLEQSLRGAGHEVFAPSRLRTRWIHLQPRRWPAAAAAAFAARRTSREHRLDLWLTYLSYYKSPDLLGPWIARSLDVPYVIFQGAYATKYRKRLATWPGFVLNRRALQAADLVTANKQVDRENLLRLLPEDKVLYVPPGVETGLFPRDPTAKEGLRAALGLGDAPVIASAAMMRRDVKAESLELLFRALAAVDRDFRLLLAGDGPMRPCLEKLACELLGERVRFLGRVPREQLHEVFNAADIFAYPGLGESLGMVYLEAQCAGLPVAACDSRGALETVAHGETGLLSPLGDAGALAASIEGLLADAGLREAMGRAATRRVRERFDAARNMQRFLDAVQRLSR
ncbi:MAG: glycosyltransferase family 4 protein [Desulfovibrionaceae bacterium]